ncbi:hypothetical protein Y032_0179g744 [Ancylostoma ceylanicum]|uniref:Uncharacterized protein n=1 Tax=Ancylostoma ceylanicum TaxID=53326 RepID=A0A016SSS6_9BILA|nr:hypothetical protein Y032_0179g744 [Ancylostoma ceylanicum]
MFQLANVASIVLDPFWGDRRKELELLNKDSKHLTVLGLAHAIAAHRSSCYAFGMALKAAHGKRIVYPPLFPQYPGYNVESYYAQVIERLDQVPQNYDDSPANPTIIAMPSPFLRGETELEENDKAKIMVYTTFDSPAAQLNERPISAAIVLVWPGSMQSTVHLNRTMHALERHLQCGGTLDMYPPPYEEGRRGTWHEIRKLCAEVVEVLTGPARGFDARVVDSYGTIGEMVALGHPATSLGTSPRRGDYKYHPWQVAVYLNQLRKFAMNTLSLPHFFVKKRDKRDEEQGDDKDEAEKPPKKKTKMSRPDVMYLRDAKTERKKQSHLIKQKGKHYDPK